MQVLQRLPLTSQHLEHFHQSLGGWNQKLQEQIRAHHENIASSLEGIIEGYQALYKREKQATIAALQVAAVQKEKCDQFQTQVGQRFSCAEISCFAAQMCQKNALTTLSFLATARWRISRNAS